MPKAKIEGQCCVHHEEWAKRAIVIEWQGPDDTPTPFNGTVRCDHKGCSGSREYRPILGTPAMGLSGSNEIIGGLALICLQCYRHLPNEANLLRQLRKEGWDLETIKVLSGHHLPQP